MNSRKTRRGRAAVMVAAISAAVALAAGCGASSPPKAAGASATPAAVATTSTGSSCIAQAYTWVHSGGGSAAIAAVAADFGKLTRDDRLIVQALGGNGSQARALSRTTNDASQLGADSTQALANPPPSCIPGEAAPYRAAMSEANEASVDTLQSVSDISRGNLQGATASIVAANTQITKGTANIETATSAVAAFNNG